MLKISGLLVVILISNAASATLYFGPKPAAKRCEGFLARNIVADYPYDAVEQIQSAAAAGFLPLAIENMIKEYRLLGGKLYWSEGKFRSGYANDADVALHEANRQRLAMLGNQLRMVVGVVQVSPGQFELIEMALTDYAKFEFKLF